MLCDCRWCDQALRGFFSSLLISTSRSRYTLWMLVWCFLLFISTLDVRWGLYSSFCVESTLCANAFRRRGFVIVGAMAADYTTNTVVGNGVASYSSTNNAINAGVFLQLNFSGMVRNTNTPLTFTFSKGWIGVQATSLTQRSYLQIYGASTAAEATQSGFAPLVVTITENVISNAQLVVKDYFSPGTQILIQNNNFTQLYSSVGSLNYYVLFYSSTFSGRSVILIAQNIFLWVFSTTTAVTRGLINIAGAGPNPFIIDDGSTFNIYRNEIEFYTANGDTKHLVVVCFGVPLAPSTAILRNFPTRVINGGEIYIAQNIFYVELGDFINGYGTFFGFLAPVGVDGSAAGFIVEQNEMNYIGYTTDAYPSACFHFVSQVTVTNGAIFSIASNVISALTTQAFYMMMFVAGSVTIQNDQPPRSTVSSTISQFEVFQNYVEIELLSGFHSGAALYIQKDAVWTVRGNGFTAGDASGSAPSAWGGVNGVAPYNVGSASFIFYDNSISGPENCGVIVDFTPRLSLQSGGCFLIEGNTMNALRSVDSGFFAYLSFYELLANGSGTVFSVSRNNHRQSDISEYQQWILSIESSTRPLSIQNGAKFLCEGNRFSLANHRNNVIVTGNFQVNSVISGLNSYVSLSHNVIMTVTDTVKGLGYTLVKHFCATMTISNRAVVRMDDNYVWSAQPDNAIGISFGTFLNVTGDSQLLLRQNELVLTSTSAFSGVCIDTFNEKGALLIDQRSVVDLSNNTNRWIGATQLDNSIMVRAVSVYVAYLFVRNAAVLSMHWNDFSLKNYSTTRYVVFGLSIYAQLGLVISNNSVLSLSDNAVLYSAIEPLGRALGTVSVLNQGGPFDIADNSHFLVQRNYLTMINADAVSFNFSNVSSGLPSDSGGYQLSGDTQDAATLIVIEGLNVRITNHSRLLVSDGVMRAGNMSRCTLTGYFILRNEGPDRDRAQGIGDVSRPIWLFPSDTLDTESFDFIVDGNSSVVFKNLFGGGLKDITYDLNRANASLRPPTPPISSSLSSIVGPVASSSFNCVALWNFKMKLSNNSLFLVHNITGISTHGMNHSIAEIRPLIMLVERESVFEVSKLNLTALPVSRSIADAYSKVFRASRNFLEGLTCSMSGVDFAFAFVQISRSSRVTVADINVTDIAVERDAAHLCRKSLIFGVAVRAFITLESVKVVPNSNGTGVLAVDRRSFFEMFGVNVDIREALTVTTANRTSPLSASGDRSGFLPIPHIQISPMTYRSIFAAILVDFQGKYAAEKDDATLLAEDILRTFDYSKSGGEAVPLTTRTTKIVIDNTSQVSVGAPCPRRISYASTPFVVASTPVSLMLSRLGAATSASSSTSPRLTSSSLEVRFEKTMDTSVALVSDGSGGGVSYSQPTYPSAILRPPIAGTNLPEQGSPLDFIMGAVVTARNFTFYDSNADTVDEMGGRLQIAGVSVHATNVLHRFEDVSFDQIMVKTGSSTDLSMSPSHSLFEYLTKNGPNTTVTSRLGAVDVSCDALNIVASSSSSTPSLTTGGGVIRITDNVLSSLEGSGGGGGLQSSEEGIVEVRRSPIAVSAGGSGSAPPPRMAARRGVLPVYEGVGGQRGLLPPSAASAPPFSHAAEYPQRSFIGLQSVVELVRFVVANQTIIKPQLNPSSSSSSSSPLIVDVSANSYVALEVPIIDGISSSSSSTASGGVGASQSVIASNANLPSYGAGLIYVSLSNPTHLADWAPGQPSSRMEEGSVAITRNAILSVSSGICAQARGNGLVGVHADVPAIGTSSFSSMTAPFEYLKNKNGIRVDLRGMQRSVGGSSSSSFVGDGVAVSVSIEDNLVSIREDAMGLEGELLVLSSSSSSAGAVSSSPFSILPAYDFSASPSLLCPFNSTRAGLFTYFSLDSQRRFKGRGGGMVALSQVGEVAAARNGGGAAALEQEEEQKDAADNLIRRLVLPWAGTRDGLLIEGEGIGVHAYAAASPLRSSSGGSSGGDSPAPALVPPATVQDNARISVVKNIVDVVGASGTRKGIVVAAATPLFVVGGGAGASSTVASSTQLISGSSSSSPNSLSPSVVVSDNHISVSVTNASRAVVASEPAMAVKGIEIVSIAPLLTVAGNTVNVSRLGASSLSLSAAAAALWDPPEAYLATPTPSGGNSNNIFEQLSVGSPHEAVTALDAARGMGLSIRFADGGWASSSSSSGSSTMMLDGGLSMHITNNTLLLTTSYGGGTNGPTTATTADGPWRRQSLVSLSRINPSSSATTSSSSPFESRPSQIEISENRLGWRSLVMGLHDGAGSASPSPSDSTVSDTYIRWEMGSSGEGGGLGDREVGFFDALVLPIASTSPSSPTALPRISVKALLSSVGEGVGMTDAMISDALSSPSASSLYTPAMIATAKALAEGGKIGGRAAVLRMTLRNNVFGWGWEDDGGWASTLVPSPSSSSSSPPVVVGGLIFSNYFSSVGGGGAFLEAICNTFSSPQQQQHNTPIWPYSALLVSRPFVWSLRQQCTVTRTQSMTFQNDTDGGDDGVRTRTMTHEIIPRERTVTLTLPPPTTTTTTTTEATTTTSVPPTTATNATTSITTATTGTTTPATTPLPTVACDAALVEVMVRSSFMNLWQPKDFVTTDAVMRSGATGIPTARPTTTATASPQQPTAATTNHSSSDASGGGGAAILQPAAAIRVPMASATKTFFEANAARQLESFLAEFQQSLMPPTAVTARPVDADPTLITAPTTVTAAGSSSASPTSSSSARLYPYLPLKAWLPAAGGGAGGGGAGAVTGGGGSSPPSPSAAVSDTSLLPLAAILRRVKARPVLSSSRSERSGFGGWATADGSSAFPSFLQTLNSVVGGGREKSPFIAASETSSFDDFFNISLFDDNSAAGTTIVDADSSNSVPQNISSFLISFSSTPSYSVTNSEFIELFTTVNDVLETLWTHFIDVEVLTQLADGRITLPYDPSQGISLGVYQQQQAKLQETYTHLLEAVFSDSCRVAFGGGGSSPSFSSAFSSSTPYSVGPSTVPIGSIVIDRSSNDPLAAAVQTSATAMSAASAFIGIIASSFMGASDMQALAAFALHSCADPHTRSALGSYRILSPLAFWDSFYGVIVGNLVVVAALFALQAIAVIVLKRLVYKVPEWLQMMALVRFPGLALNVLFTLLTGSLFAAAELVSSTETSNSSEMAVGAVGVIFGFILPILLVFVAHRFITRAYQEYAREDWVAEKGYFADLVRRNDDDIVDDADHRDYGLHSRTTRFKKWLLFFFMPEGVIYSPQTRQAFASFISLHKRQELFWPSYATWTPFIVMIAGLVSSPSDSTTGCLALYGVLCICFVAIAIFVAVLRPFRSQFLNVLEVCSKLVNAAVLASIGAAVFNTQSAADAAKISVFIGLVQVALSVIRVLYGMAVVYFDKRVERDLIGLVIIWSHIANVNEKSKRRSFFTGGISGNADVFEGLDEAANTRELDGVRGDDDDDPDEGREMAELRGGKHKKSKKGSYLAPDVPLMMGEGDDGAPSPNIFSSQQPPHRSAPNATKPSPSSLRGNNRYNANANNGRDVDNTNEILPPLSKPQTYGRKAQNTVLMLPSAGGGRGEEDGDEEEDAYGEVEGVAAAVVANANADDDLVIEDDDLLGGGGGNGVAIVDMDIEIDIDGDDLLGGGGGGAAAVAYSPAAVSPDAYVPSGFYEDTFNTDDLLLGGGGGGAANSRSGGPKGNAKGKAFSSNAKGKAFSSPSSSPPPRASPLLLSSPPTATASSAAASSSSKPKRKVAMKKGPTAATSARGKKGGGLNNGGESFEDI